MLTKVQLDVLNFVIEHIDESGIAPSQRQIEDATNSGLSSVNRILNLLEERGYIRKVPYRRRAIEILRRPGQMSQNESQEYKLGFQDGWAAAMEHQKNKKRKWRKKRVLSRPGP